MLFAAFPARDSNSGVAVRSKLALSELLLKVCDVLALKSICLLSATEDLSEWLAVSAFDTIYLELVFEDLIIGCSFFSRAENSGGILVSEKFWVFF